MKQNKSIDGLVTHAAKAPVPSLSQPEKVKKPKKSLSVAVLEPDDPLVSDDSLTIEVKNADLPFSEPTASNSASENPENSENSATATKSQTVEDFLAPVSALNLDTPKKSAKKSHKKIIPSYTPDQKNHTSAKNDQKTEKKKISKKRTIITTILLSIILLIIGFVLWAILWGNDIIAKITGGQGSVLDLLSLTSETYEPLKTDANSRTNILAFGTSGYDMSGDEGNGIHDGAQLTDSIMLISLNQKTGDIAMFSLPRDLKASPTCTATGKINEVYWCNNMYGEDEEAGARALMTEVGSILGVDFQYYAHLNWGSLINIVDILGGIDITLDEDIHDYYWTGAVFEAGVTYTINGEQALGLARARHGTAGGDFSRGASQQKILIGIKNKVFEKSLSISDLLGLASTLGDNLRTNFSLSEMKTLAHLTSEFDFDSMRSLSLYPDFMTTGTINGISYVLPRAGVGNYGAIQEYVATKLSNDPRTYEEPTILVLNATDVVGLASTERAKLLADGYKSVSTDNAPEGEYTRGYLLYSSHEKPGTEDLLEKTYSVEAWDYSELPAGISKEYDFVLIINPKTEESNESNSANN